MERTFHKWTSAETLLLINNFDSMTRLELAELLGVSFNAIKRKAYDLKLKKSAESIKKLTKRPNAGQFKKGSIPLNTLTDGVITTRLDQRGRIIKYIRIGLGKWMELQHYNWEKAGFERTKGMVLAFKDGDSTNCDVSNLMLITKAENLARNKPAPSERPVLQAKIVGSRKSVTAKKAIKKEEKRRMRRAKRVGEVKLKEFKKAENLLKNIAPDKIKELTALNYKDIAAELKVKQQKEAEKQKKADTILRNEQKRLAKARKERERINTEIEEKKTLPTRQIDYSQLIQLRIDHKTVIYVKPGADIEKIKAKYHKPVHDPYADLPPVYEF